MDTGYDVCLYNIIGTQLIQNSKTLLIAFTLILTRSNNLYIGGFSNNYINYIIHYIANN